MEIINNKYENWINSNKVTSWMNSFVNSYYFLFLIGLIVLISSSFSAEVVCFGILALLAIISFSVSSDTKPLIIIILTFQMGMSYKNSLSYNPDPSAPNIYDNKAILIYFFILAILVIAFGIFNLFIFKNHKKLFKRSIYILPCLLCLCIGYILGGVGGPTYSKDILFSLSNAGTLLGLFVYFSDTAFKNKNESIIKYISIIMIVSSLLIGLEIVRIYITNNVIADGKIDKGRIRNGWGQNNNFAGYFAITLPFNTYLIIKEKKNLKYYISYLFIILFTISTLSRNGYALVLFETIISLILIYIFKKESRKKIIIASSIAAAIMVLLIIIFHQKIYSLLQSLIEAGFSLAGREELYEIAWDSFLKRPLFGEGWFIIDKDWGKAPNSFSPNCKTHNIVLQLLGSTGIFGFICFMILISYLTYIFFKNKSEISKICYLGILTLILSSIFDNFFFDYGFERYLAIFLVGICIAQKEEKENINSNTSKVVTVNE